MKRLSLLRFLPLALLLLASCAQRDMSAPMPAASRTVSPGPTQTVADGWVYTDAKLGFHLTLPNAWQAQPQPGSRVSLATAAVTFSVNESSSHALIDVGVFHGPTMPAAFAELGLPTTHVGPYPAFVADRSASQGRAPCLVRIFLADDDYVLADWCAPSVLAFQTAFEQVLATYLPAASGFVTHASEPSPQTCADIQLKLGYTQASWGRQLAIPTSSAWRQVGNGVYICSNAGSSDWYLFQCTELVNRFLSEQWGLPHLPGNAARYFDYYQDGIVQPGVIRTFPAGSYQLFDDASQGKSASAPVAGDLLVFQDVNNPKMGWTSGLTSSPGHVALIVGMDATHVYVAQENYNDTQYFLALPLRHVAAGYEITDLSGLSQRIVRGWIHFTVV